MRLSWLGHVFEKSKVIVRWIIFGNRFKAICKFIFFLACLDFSAFEFIHNVIAIVDFCCWKNLELAAWLLLPLFFLLLICWFHLQGQFVQIWPGWLLNLLLIQVSAISGNSFAYEYWSPGDQLNVFGVEIARIARIARCLTDFFFYREVICILIFG